MIFVRSSEVDRPTYGGSHISLAAWKVNDYNVGTVELELIISSTLQTVFHIISLSFASIYCTKLIASNL